MSGGFDVQDAGDRFVLSHLDLNLLAKVAATVYDHDLLDLDATDYRVADLCRRCSEALADGRLLAITITERSLMETIAGARENGSSREGD